MNKGIWYAVGAYLIWGFFPIYLKAIQEVPALQTLSHRIIWSFLFVVLLIVVRKDWPRLKSALQNARFPLIYALTAGLLAINWLVYIYGINTGQVVETSLGYFINPLLSVALGVIFLRERLRPMQWFPIGLAALGVLYLTVQLGSLPWIALALAFSFGLYGLLKKITPLGALHGLTMETGILCIPALIYLLYAESQADSAFGQLGLTTSVLLAFSGIVTALPLLFFSRAARSIPLSLLGILQYIAPTVQFLLGVFLYQEPFTLTRLVGFVIIWLSLAIFTMEGIYDHRKHSVAHHRL